MRELEAGDVGGFLIEASNQASLHLVYMNLKTLQERGLYEEALLGAFVSTRTNNHGWSLDDLHFLFKSANRERLRAEGAPLPCQGPFTLFRGVAGVGRARRVRGLSWTASLEQAAWFANRFSGLFDDPAVFRVTVTEKDVYAYQNERNEEEFIVGLPATAKPVRVLDGEDLAAPAAKVAARLAKARDTPARMEEGDAARKEEMKRRLLENYQRKHPEADLSAFGMSDKP